VLVPAFFLSRGHRQGASRSGRNRACPNFAHGLDPLGRPGQEASACIFLF